MFVVLEDATSVELTWSPPSPLGDTTGYRISYTGASSSSETVTGGSTGSYLLTGLQTGETYSISIVATSAHFPSYLLEWEPITLLADMGVSGSGCESRSELSAAAIVGGVLGAVIVALVVVLVMVILVGKYRRAGHSTGLPTSESERFRTTNNEAYNVVRERGETDGDYDAVIPLQNLPSVSHRPTSGDYD
jgi:uncharacterized membrane protein